MKSVYEIGYIATIEYRPCWFSKKTKIREENHIGCPWIRQVESIYASSKEEAIAIYQNKIGVNLENVQKRLNGEDMIYGGKVVSIQYKIEIRRNVSMEYLIRNLSAEDFVEWCKDHDFPPQYINERK